MNKEQYDKLYKLLGVASKLQNDIDDIIVDCNLEGESPKNLEEAWDSADQTVFFLQKILGEKA
jgi:hypothetical protein